MYKADEAIKSSPSAVYGLTTKAKCVAAQVGETDKVTFLVGTFCLKEENEIHLVEYMEDENDIKCLYILSHPKGEIWSLSPCPSDSSLFFTCYQSVKDNESNRRATLWRIKDQDLEEVYTLSDSSEVKSLLWDPSETTQSESLISLEENSIKLWKLGKGSPTQAAAFTDVNRVTTGAWNPHHAEVIATAHDNNIRGWDLRVQKETYIIRSAHSPFVRDIDFNPNRDYYLVSGGDDNKIKFWDIRKSNRPVKAIPSAHSHWVWNVKYNRYHDQFVLSGSTDQTVCLWNMPSVSSVNASDSTANKGAQTREDRLVKRYQDIHEDSVYSIAWGMAPWVFASLSYDGRLVINHVPKVYSDMLQF